MASAICRYIFLSVTALLQIHIQNSVATSNRCLCELELVTKTANCSRLLLKDIPICVPSGTVRLDLSYNMMNYHPGQFKRFKDIAYIDLSGNVIFFPDGDTFSGLTQLKTLYLNETNLPQLQARFVSEPSNIEILSFCEDRLPTIPTKYFSNLNFLTDLD